MGQQRTDEGRKLPEILGCSGGGAGSGDEGSGAAARNAIAFVAIGVIERDTEFSGGSLFCSVLFFNSDGELIGIHRKLKPTGSERLIWSEGDGSTMPVIDTPAGRTGALICWENAACRSHAWR